MVKVLLVLFINTILFSNSINFETALLLSLKNNKELKAKKLSIDISKLDLQQALNYDYGSLVFNSSFTRTNHAGHAFSMKLSSRQASFRDFGFTQQLEGIDVQPEDLNFPSALNNFENKISYDVPLFTGYKLTHAKKIAKLQVLANKVLYNFNDKTLSLEVLKAYNGAVSAKYFIKATQKAKNATASFVNFAKELYKEGLVTQIDVKQASVQDLNVNAKIREALNKYNLALAYLKFLTNNSMISDVKDFESIQLSKKNLKEFQNTAIKKREDILWMKHNLQTLKSKIKMEKSALYPSIGAHIEYGYNNNTFDGFDDNHNYYLAAIGLKYSILDPTSKVTIQKAKVNFKKASYYFEHMKDGIKLEVENNFLTLLSKNDILVEKIKAKELAQEILEQSKEMYKNHLINMTNLLSQQANEQQANAQAIMSKYESTMAIAKLKLSLGLSLKE